MLIATSSERINTSLLFTSHGKNVTTYLRSGALHPYIKKAKVSALQLIPVDSFYYYYYYSVCIFRPDR